MTNYIDIYTWTTQRIKETRITKYITFLEYKYTKILYFLQMTMTMTMSMCYLPHSMNPTCKKY